MARRHGHRRILPFRIPMFRIFYSVTYTVLYFLLLVILAITPASLIYGAFSGKSYQYVFMVGGAYILTLILAIVIYSGRIYTTRAVLAAVGKAYIPIEEGEVSKKIRKMIVKQLERSAEIAWESKPRDIEGELLAAERRGLLPVDSPIFNHTFHPVGQYISINHANPPWGNVQHAGWSSPSSRAENKNPHIQYAKVIAELPHLIEAQAVSLAPPDPSAITAEEDDAEVDPVILGVLRRPPNAGLREYMTQLSCLGLIQPPEVGQSFLARYERARFSARPTSTRDFDHLMHAFAQVLSGMTELPVVIVNEIRKQTQEDTLPLADAELPQESPEDLDNVLFSTPSTTKRTAVSSMLTPVTAFESRSRATTPFVHQSSGSEETIGSVLQRRPSRPTYPYIDNTSATGSQIFSSSLSVSTDAGSVIRYSANDPFG